MNMNFLRKMKGEHGMAEHDASADAAFKARATQSGARPGMTDRNNAARLRKNAARLRKNIVKGANTPC